MGIKTKFNPMGGKIEGKDIEFVRPNLSANGTLGGSAFAVSASSQYSSSTPAYRAVDGTTNYWRPNTAAGNPYYIFYNPNALKVTVMVFTPTAAQYPQNVSSIFGSNDNSEWTEILHTYSYQGSTLTLTLTNSKYYKYYKIVFTSASGTGRVQNIAITATYKI